ncbi:gp53-like domain-containing protein [Paenibacillus sp. YIM B09110]|uniref:gp53-like domain-containing protein n=1 Tax=Paenibacillus sp. YIM B09110 TaxID=3126102 RepID=UPI00301DA80B
MPDITPRIGLKKPLGNEVFSRAGYNENLDTLETVAETQAGAQAKASAAVAPVTARLDAQEAELNTTIPLVQGAQTVLGGKAAAFAFPRIDGRSQVNGLGFYGNFSSTSGWNGFGSGTLAAAGNVITVTGNGTITNPQIARNVSLATPIVGDKIFLRAYMRQVSGAPTSLQLVIYDNVLQYTAQAVASPVLGTWYQLAGVITVTQSLIDNWANARVTAMSIYSSATASNGFKTDIREVAIFPLPAADAALTRDQLLVKYPWTGTGLNSVVNPSVTSIQDNLLPPFNEWTNRAAGIVPSVYNATIVASSTAGVNMWHEMTVKAGETYTYSVTHTGRTAIDFTAGGVSISSPTGWSAAQNLTVTVPAGAETMRVFVSNGNLVGTFTFSNPMLVKGTVSQTHKPQVKSTLTFHTRLHGLPDGTVSDDVRYIDGKAVKRKRVEKLVLDGSLAWVWNADATGYKSAKVLIATPIDYKGTVTKYDGKVLLRTGTATAADQSIVRASDSSLYITIADADSGWGESYEPTAAEIKAYFNGWRMFLWGGAPNVPYNGTGSKGWAKIYFGIGSDNFGSVSGSAIQTLPTTANDQGFTPYQVHYQLADSVYEEVPTSGALVIESGDNHVVAPVANIPAQSMTITYAATAYSALAELQRALAGVMDGRTAKMSTANLFSEDQGVKRARPTFYLWDTEIGSKAASIHAYENALVVKGRNNVDNANLGEVFRVNLDTGEAYAGSGGTNKVWHDGNAALSLTGNGYQKLPSGVIIQWGVAAATTTLSTVTLPIAFPNSVFSVSATATGTTGIYATVNAAGLTSFSVRSSASSNVNWITIGW